MDAEPNSPQLPVGEIPRLENDPDTQAIIEKLMTGTPLDPEVYRRIRAEGEQARKEYEKRNGITDIAADLVREVCDENEDLARTNPPMPIPYEDVLSPELEADTQAIIDKLMTGKPLDPETYRRIRERAEKITEEVYRRFGLLDIGVPAIRALRDGDEE